MADQTRVHVETVGELGVILAMRTIERLIEKGVFVDTDAHVIYERAIKNFETQAEKREAAAVLRTLAPGLEIK